MEATAQVVPSTNRSVVFACWRSYVSHLIHGFSGPRYSKRLSRSCRAHVMTSHTFYSSLDFVRDSPVELVPAEYTVLKLRLNAFRETSLWSFTKILYFIHY